jgi:RimJ/RimL family protein N-acetyltransferase
MTLDVVLREVAEEDLPTFFEQQRDPDANYMAAFTAKDPSDHEAFTAHWQRILSDETNTTRTILFNNQVAGHIASYIHSGTPEVTYWLGREYWGRGVASRALLLFLDLVTARPLYARAAKDNVGSLRVLEKCGFTITGEDRGFANARGEETEEWLLELRENNA